MFHPEVEGIRCAQKGCIHMMDNAALVVATAETVALLDCDVKERCEVQQCDGEEQMRRQVHTRVTVGARSRVRGGCVTWCSAPVERRSVGKTSCTPLAFNF